jgi:hypothetical protein
MKRNEHRVEKWFLVVQAEGLRDTALRCAGVLMTILAGLRSRAFVVRSVEHALEQLGVWAPLDQRIAEER